MALAPIAPDDSLRFRRLAESGHAPTKDDWDRLIRDLLDLQQQVTSLEKRIYSLEHP